MYKLVIVEDEPTTRRGLECFVPWKDMGFEVVGVFANGEDALAWMRNHSCDVIMTDIKMGRMDGLELTYQLHILSPMTKVVIISGYSDFEYTKRAIQNKVFDYLLKPIDEDDLERVFRELRDTMDAESQEMEAQETLGYELLGMLQISFLKNLLAGQIQTISEMELYLKLTNTPLSIRNAPVLAYEVKLMPRDFADSDSDEGSLISKEVGEKLRRHCASQSGEFLCFLLDGSEFSWTMVVIALNCSDLAQLKQHYQKNTLPSLLGIQESEQYEITGRLTHAVQHMSDLVSGISADKAFEEELSEDNQNGEMYERLLMKNKILIVALDLAEHELVYEILDGLQSELSLLRLEQARFVMKNMLDLVAQEYRSRNIDTVAISNGQFDSAVISKSASLDELMNQVRSAFQMLYKGFQEVRAEYNTDILGTILQYIDRNIASDLGNDELSQRYHIHPAYLSRIFKQKVGEKLSEYITRVRIEKAILLLRDKQNSVQDISQMVGYKSVSYFSSIFRKYTGYSTREYYLKVLA